MRSVGLRSGRIRFASWLAWGLLLLTFLLGINLGRLLVSNPKAAAEFQLLLERRRAASIAPADEVALVPMPKQASKSDDAPKLISSDSPLHWIPPRREVGIQEGLGEAIASKDVENGQQASGPSRLSTVRTDNRDSLGSRGFVQPLLPPDVLRLLNRRDSMVDLSAPFQPRCQTPPNEKESSTNYAFLAAFEKILREAFDHLPWWLDEGGLIGAARAGAMINADDDFDFFVVLPNQHAPCRSDSLTCTREEYQTYIHRFLMTFWNAGMCINKFHPDPARFQSKGRLMYSFQLNRPADVEPDRCFHEGKPFAHMHLGIFNDEGLLETNIWAKHTTHPIDQIPLNVVLPVRRCRIGHMDAPCPNNVTEYLTIRNRGEYRKKSSDGSCLLVKQKWGKKRKVDQVQKAIRLRDCGYAGMFELIDPFVSSDYTAC